MSADTISDRELARLLDEQIAALSQVRSTLQAERTALYGRDAQALDAAVAAKAQSLSVATELEARRQSAVRGLGFAARPGVPGPTWRPDNHLAQRWQQLMALAHECQDLNEGNGSMISAQRRRVDGALRLMRGTTTAPGEYGAAGLPRGVAGQRSLASI